MKIGYKILSVVGLVLIVLIFSFAASTKDVKAATQCCFCGAGGFPCANAGDPCDAGTCDGGVCSNGAGNCTPNGSICYHGVCGSCTPAPPQGCAPAPGGGGGGGNSQVNINTTPTGALNSNVKGIVKSQVQNMGGAAGFNMSLTVEDIIATIIQVILSVLGIIFLVLIVMSGYQWMTAAGNEETIKKAQGQLKSAVIGLVIVLAAWAITVFIFTNLPFGQSGSNQGGVI